MRQNEETPQIESRNLTNLMDLMSHESVAYSKAKHYGGLVQDAEAKQAIEQVKQHHRDCFQALEQYLSSHN